MFSGEIFQYAFLIFLVFLCIAGVGSAIYIAFYSSTKVIGRNKIKPLEEEDDVSLEEVSQRLKPYFVDSREEIEAVTGKRLVLNYAGRGSSKQAFACLTGKRIYVLGRHKKNGKRTNENDYVALDKVTNIYIDEPGGFSWIVSIILKILFLILMAWVAMDIFGGGSFFADLDYQILEEYGETVNRIAIAVFGVLWGGALLISIPLAVSIFYDVFKYKTDKIIRLTIQHTEGRLDLTYSWLDEEETLDFIDQAEIFCNMARQIQQNAQT